MICLPKVFDPSVPRKADGGEGGHAGEAGHMLDISDWRSERFACALALQLGPSFLQAQGWIHRAGYIMIEVSLLLLYLSCNFYLKSPLYIYIINATCSWHAILHIVNIEFGDIKYYKSTGGPLKPTSPQTYKGPSALRMDRKSRQYGTPWMNRWMRELQSTNSSSRSRLTNGPSIDRRSSKSFVNRQSHTWQTYI